MGATTKSYLPLIKQRGLWRENAVGCLPAARWEVCNTASGRGLCEGKSDRARGGGPGRQVRAGAFSALSSQKQNSATSKIPPYKGLVLDSYFAAVPQNHFSFFPRRCDLLGTARRVSRNKKKEKSRRQTLENSATCGARPLRRKESRTGEAGTSGTTLYCVCNYSILALVV